MSSTMDPSAVSSSCVALPVLSSPLPWSLPSLVKQHLGMWAHLQVPFGPAWWHTYGWEVLVGAHAVFAGPLPNAILDVFCCTESFIVAKSVSGCGCKE